MEELLLKSETGEEIIRKSVENFVDYLFLTKT
jgi:hypothetical protein